MKLLQLPSRFFRFPTLNIPCSATADTKPYKDHLFRIQANSSLSSNKSKFSVLMKADEMVLFETPKGMKWFLRGAW